ncbi:MAG: RNA methyltransferase [Candidatus Kaiserbacteria bacterium]|nr:RNA methyltransferase [Candidatus Kaiserbacteria bacterium]
MLSIKNVKRLAEKKYRNEHGLFMVEGEKNIKELLNSDFIIEGIFVTTPFLDSVIDLINAYDERMGTHIELKEVREVDLVRGGTFVTNTTGIAVVRQKEEPALDTVIEEARENIVLMLDDVRDPGNLGTIIRIADWYGVAHIVASSTTTDFYNPKVISATMGSFTRINVLYSPLEDIFMKARELNIPVIATTMDGASTHESKLPQSGFLLMGSESHGVNTEILTHATHQVTIPRFGKAESLNVSVATGILLDTIRRNSL